MDETSKQRAECSDELVHAERRGREIGRRHGEVDLFETKRELEIVKLQYDILKSTLISLYLSANQASQDYSGSNWESLSKELLNVKIVLDAVLGVSNDITD